MNSFVGTINSDDDAVEEEKTVDIVATYLLPEYQTMKFEITSKLKMEKVPQSVMMAFKAEMNTGSKLTWVIYEELKSFLLLTIISKPSAPLIAPPFVKMAWEYLIIETKRYESFCKVVFNKFIHCPPLPETGDKTHQKNYSLTMDLYRRVFAKDPNVEVWPRSTMRFNASLPFYKNKFINIRGSLSEIINKIKPLPRRKDER